MTIKLLKTLARGYGMDVSFLDVGGNLWRYI